MKNTIYSLHFVLLSSVLTTIAFIVLSFTDTKPEARDKVGSITCCSLDGGIAYYTCTTSDGRNHENECNVTAGTWTTATGSGNSYDGNGNQTVDNTTTF